MTTDQNVGGSSPSGGAMEIHAQQGFLSFQSATVAGSTSRLFARYWSGVWSPAETKVNQPVGTIVSAIAWVSVARRDLRGLGEERFGDAYCLLRSEMTRRAALCPGAPVTPPPGWAPDPHRYRFWIGVRY
jgi:hypothetical protein